jgi:hypothetical protein
LKTGLKINFEKMIEDFVRENVAYLRCTECGKETTILKMHFVPEYTFPVIDHKATMNELEAFSIKHALCKKDRNMQSVIF